MKKRPVRKTERRKAGLAKIARLPLGVRWAGATFGADYDEDAVRFVTIWWDQLLATATAPDSPAKMKKLFDDPVAWRMVNAFAEGESDFFRKIADALDRECDPLNKTAEWLARNCVGRAAGTGEAIVEQTLLTAREAWERYVAETGDPISLDAFEVTARRIFPSRSPFVPAETRGWHKGKRRKPAAKK